MKPELKKYSDSERLLFSVAMESAITAVWTNGNLTPDQRKKIETDIRQAGKETFEQMEARYTELQQESEVNHTEADALRNDFDSPNDWRN